MAAIGRPKQRATGNPSSSDRIKDVARVLLVRHGYQGLRYADIADELSITRANVHYHFGSKQKLVEAVIEDYMNGALERFESIWTGIDRSYADKVKATIEFNRERYIQFNNGLIGRQPWSLIDRMRNDANLVSERARSALARLEVVDAYVSGAIRLAQARGEIAEDAPAEHIALQLMTIIDCAGSITQTRGAFAPLEKVYLAHLELVMDGYGKDRCRGESRPTTPASRPSTAASG